MNTSKKTAAAKKTALAPKSECNVSGCANEPTHRGLCDAHWDTHRGLADPKEGNTP